jgi:hypothetical protein
MYCKLVAIDWVAGSPFSKTAKKFISWLIAEVI